MPIYEYQCRICQELTDKYFPNTDAPAALKCGHCGSEETRRIISGAVYHQSESTKTSKLDSKYEKMVDHAMSKSTSADPDRLLRKMKPFPVKK